MSLPTPNTRKEQYLNAIATGNAGGLPTPITREEEYLDAIAKSGGGGGGGTTNYNALDNKPQIAGTTLQGNKTLNDLGIAGEDAIEDIYAVMGEMSAKNLNKFPYKNGGAGDVWSTNGIDFTVLADGSIDVNRASSSSNPAYFRCGIPTENFNPIYLKAGEKYILSGSVSGVGVNLRDSTNATVVTSSSGEEELFNCSNSGNYYIIISVAKDASPVHALVKPMLRLASDTDNTYQRYAKTNKQLTDEIANKVDKVEGKGLSTNDYTTAEKTKLAGLSNYDDTAVWDGINRIMLPGRDLTVIFADEIANYSDEWAWIQARLNSHNVSGLRVGDYIPIKVGAENHLAEIAGINTYRRTGNTGHEVGYHIDWITRDCYSQTVQFNTTNNNNGNANSPSPFLASNLKSWLDGTLYPLLDAKLKAVIKAKRILAPYRYQSGATLTDDNSWGWQDFDKLWVPLEGEIFDSLVWSTKGYGNGQAVQYPIFANSYEHRMKGAGPGGARADWWTASAHSGSSTSVVLVTCYGTSAYANASSALCVPVCFRTMEA